MAALQKHPVLNGSIDEVTHEIVMKSYYHIGLAVDTQLPPSPKPSVASQDGMPVTHLNLSQRVVAKLLTQTYQTAIPAGARYLKDNPRDSLYKDAAR